MVLVIFGIILKMVVNIKDFYGNSGNGFQEDENALPYFLDVFLLPV